MRRGDRPIMGCVADDSVDTGHSADRRELLAAMARWTAVIALRGDLGCKAIDALAEDFTPEEIKRIFDVLKKVSEKFPNEKFGHINAPFYFDNEGDLFMKLADTDVSQGWDCFDVSVNLARELSAAGFEAGVVRGSDNLRIWGTHSRVFITKHGKNFELDLTPPYHNANREFPDSKLGHTIEESRPFNQIRINTAGRAYNQDKRIQGGAGYTVAYHEAENERAKRGFLFSVVLLQREEIFGSEAFGMIINRDNGPIKISILIDVVAISDGYFGTAFDNTLKLAFELNEDGHGLTLVHAGMTFQMFNGYREVYFKALEVAKETRRKLDAMG